jgi:Big-like domain-containing protein
MEEDAMLARFPRRTSLTLVGVVALVVAIANPAAAPPGDASTSVVNGSFETPDVPAGSFSIFPTIPGWFHAPAPQAASSSGIEVQDHFAGDPAAGAGDQFVELDSDGPSRIFQDVATNPGSTYSLTFVYSARPNTAADQNHFQASAGPESVVIGPLVSASQTNWVGFTFDFFATDTSSRIEYLDLGPEEATGGVGAYIDEVVVTLVNSAPIAADDSATAVNGIPVNIDVLFNDSDPDGDALTVTGVTQGTNGTVTINGDGTVTYDPVCFQGMDSFAYAIDDGNGGTDDGMVTVRVRKTSRRGSTPCQ